MNSEVFRVLMVVGEAESVFDGATGEVRSEFVAESARNLAEVFACEPTITHKTTSYGRGADTAALLLYVAGAAVTALLAGKKIEENLDAWRRLGVRLRRWMKARRSAVFLDRNLALALALDHIVAKLRSGEEILAVSTYEVRLQNRSCRSDLVASFESTPERYYFYFVRTNHNEHVLCIRSTGSVSFHKALDRWNWQEFVLSTSKEDPA